MNQKNDTYEWPDDNDNGRYHLHAVIKIKGHNNEIIPYNSSSHILIDSLFKYASDKKKDSDDDYGDKYNCRFKKEFFLLLFLCLLLILYIYTELH